MEDKWQTIKESVWLAAAGVLREYRSSHDTHPWKEIDPRAVEALAA